MIAWFKRCDELLRHPLTLTLVGFILTGFLGTYITDRLHRDETERTAVAAQRERGTTAIQEIAELINERRTRAVMVSSAIKRDSPAEVQVRKTAYDEVYVRWNMKEDSMLDQIQEYLKLVVTGGDRTYIDEYAHNFRVALTSTYAMELRQGERRADRSDGGLLSRMDDCITMAFDEYRRTNFGNAEPAKAKLLECHFDDLDDRMIDCTHLLTEQLYSVINRIGEADHAVSTDIAFRKNIWAIHGGCNLAAN